jgi:hypothetical protein
LTGLHVSSSARLHSRFRELQEVKGVGHGHSGRQRWVVGVRRHTVRLGFADNAEVLCAGCQSIVAVRLQPAIKGTDLDEHVRSHAEPLQKSAPTSPLRPRASNATTEAITHDAKQLRLGKRLVHVRNDIFHVAHVNARRDHLRLVTDTPSTMNHQAPRFKGKCSAEGRP